MLATVTFISEWSRFLGIRCAGGRVSGIQDQSDNQSISRSTGAEQGGDKNYARRRQSPAEAEFLKF